MQTLFHTDFLIQQTSGIWEGFLGVRAFGLEKLFCLLPVEVSGSLVRSCGQYRSTASFFSHQIVAGFTHVQLCLMRAGTFPSTPGTSPEGSAPCAAGPRQGMALQRLQRRDPGAAWTAGAAPHPRRSCVPAARADSHQHSNAWSPRRNALVQVRGCTSHLNTNFVTGKHSCFE